MSFDDTKIVEAMEPNFRYKVILGCTKGPGLDCSVLPWPSNLPEAGYKTGELMEAIQLQYKEGTTLANIGKLAVLTLQQGNGTTPVTTVLSVYPGHVGPEFCQEYVDVVAQHPSMLLLSAAIDGAPKDMPWRFQTFLKFLMGTVQYIMLMDAFHHAKSLNLAGLLGATVKTYGAGIVDPGLLLDTGLAKIHYTAQKLFSDARVDACSHGAVLAGIWQASDQSCNGLVTVLWHFYSRVVKFTSVHYGESSFGKTRCLLNPSQRLFLLGSALSFYLQIDGLHATTKANAIHTTVSHMFYLCSLTPLHRLFVFLHYFYVYFECLASFLKFGPEVVRKRARKASRRSAQAVDSS